MKHFKANPSINTDQWYVWDIYEPLPPKPVFFGTMEEAWLVSDRLNERIWIGSTRGRGIYNDPDAGRF